MRAHALLRSPLLLVVVLAGAACATPAGPGRCKVTMVMQTAPDINPNEEGDPLPTTVQFLQLKSVDKLKNASFEDVWQRPQESLGDDLVEVQEQTLYPDQKRSDDLLVNEETQYVAAVALFRSPKGNEWRTFTQLAPAGTVERCAEEKPGGPFYFLLTKMQIRGSYKPFAEPGKAATKK